MAVADAVLVVGWSRRHAPGATSRACGTSCCSSSAHLRCAAPAAPGTIWSTAISMGWSNARARARSRRDRSLSRKRQLSCSRRHWSGLLVLIQFNRFTVLTGLASLLVVVIYPFMKRITYWPQIFLGLAFSWGALMGWPAAFGRLDWPALVLYAGSICWVIGYDTIYAHQDREDDLLIGIKSTALLFGERTPSMLAGFYACAVVLIAAAGFMAGGGMIFAAGLIAFARASGLAGDASRHRRSGALPDAVQIQPRCRAYPVWCDADRRCNLEARVSGRSAGHQSISLFWKPALAA